MPARPTLSLAEKMWQSVSAATVAPLQPARIVKRVATAPPYLTSGLGPGINFPFSNAISADYAVPGDIPWGVSYYEMNASGEAATVVVEGSMAVELDPAAAFTQIGQLVYPAAAGGLATNVKGANIFVAGVTESLPQVAVKPAFPEGTRGLYPAEGQFYTPWPLSGPGNIRGGPGAYFILTAAQAANLGAAGVPITGGVYEILTNLVTTALDGILTVPEVAAQLVMPAGLIRFVGASPFSGNLRYVLMRIMTFTSP
jgi:Uncharacterized conserved protein (DUF2190)